MRSRQTDERPWFPIAVMGALAACSAGAPDLHAHVDVGQVGSAPATSSTADASKQIVPHPAAGRSGWFYVHGPQEALAALIGPDQCLAVHNGRRFLITPNHTMSTTPLQVRSACDGVAAKAEWGWRGKKVFALKNRVFFAESSDFFIAAPATAEQRPLDAPFARPSALIATGDSMLALAVPENEKKATLYRLDGEQWTTVKLDAGEVTSVIGSPEGLAYAVTTKNVLYSSIDDGATWKPLPLAEKGLLLGQLHLLPSEPGALAGVPHLEVKRKVDGPSLESTLSPEMSISSFRARFLTNPPVGVVTPDGVPLDVQAQTTERLVDANVCGPPAHHGSSAVVACNGSDMAELVLRHTQDGGTTIREIARMRPACPLSELAMTDSKVLMVFACRGSLTDDRRSEHIRVLERGEADAWTERRVEIVGQSQVYGAVPDRTVEGGFYLRGTSLKGAAQAPITSLIHVSSQGATTFALTDKLRRSRPEQPVSVGAMSVDDDGTLGFIVLEGQTYIEPNELSYQHFTKDGALLEKRVLGGDRISYVQLQRIGLVGRKIVGLHSVQGSLLVSDDAGESFTEHEPEALRAFSRSFVGATPTQLLCGSAGCDLIDPGNPMRLAWRWGTEALRDTLTEERSKGIE